MTERARFRYSVARLALGALVTALALSAAFPARAQTETGAICVATYADLNGNAIREETETPLAGITVNLSTGGEVIATHVMAEGEAQYCFENLLTGAYTITFVDDPAFRSTTANEGTFNLDPGQRLTITDYGAIPLTTAEDQPAQTSATVLETTPDDEELQPTARLIISAIASIGVMIFMIGVGAIVLSMRMRQRRDPRRARRYPQGYPPPPTRIRPPGA